MDRWFAQSILYPLMIVKDFNEILSEHENRGGAPVNHNSCLGFYAWIEDYRLMDMGLVRLNSLG